MASTRIRPGTAAGLVTLAISLVAFGGTPALATQGQPVIAGYYSNAASNTTGLYLDCSIQPYCSGISSTFRAAWVANTNNALYGAAVWGSSGSSPISPSVVDAAVLGSSSVSAGTGVEGVSDYGNYVPPKPGGDGVFGYSSTGGYGVDGRAPGYIGVYGEGDTAVLAIGTSNGVDAHGDTAIEGFGTTYGVRGSGDTGVYGQGSTANGVFGQTNASTASGVYGQNDAGGFGVAGRAVNGTGLFGDAAHGTGAWASTEDGTALKVTAGTGGTGITATAPGVALSVQGKAKFSRSGVATVAGTTAAPTNSVKVSLPITAKSMMTATLQTYVPGIFVVAAVPDVAGGSFTIYLNKQVSTSVGPVSWMVVERP